MARKIMVIGPTGCGKTSLINYLNDDADKPVKRTQDLMFGKNTVDVPGSYLESPWMYNHLISAAQNHAGQVVILINQDNIRDIYPPGFAKVFTCPVTGVVTKCDLKPENKQRCLDQLKKSGCEKPFFRVSVKDGLGIEDLKEHLFKEIKDVKGGQG